MTGTAKHTCPLMGVAIDALRMEDVLAVCEDAIRGRGRLLLGVVNAAKLVNMHRDEKLRAAVLSADLILADGMAVVWAARLLGRGLPERVTGIDLMHRLLERADACAYRVFCLGARAEVLDEVARRIRTDYPGAQLVGTRDGYFTAEQEADVANQIAAARPDMLFVAMTSPRKEEFLARWADRIDVPVCHGVGGSFDVLAGKVRRAPPGWQRLGLEWLYRVVQEPRRMWKRYLVTNTLFCGMLLREMFSTRTARQTAQ